jgi:hypothetical protein
MVVEENIQGKMNFAEQEMPTRPVTRSASLFDEGETISGLSRIRSVYIIDFFAERNRLPAVIEASEGFETNLKATRAAAPPLPSIGQMDRFEESLYWLISAATLIYLLFVIVTS